MFARTYLCVVCVTWMCGARNLFIKQCHLVLKCHESIFFLLRSSCVTRKMNDWMNVLYACANPPDDDDDGPMPVFVPLLLLLVVVVTVAAAAAAASRASRCIRFSIVFTRTSSS